MKKQKETIVPQNIEIDLEAFARATGGYSFENNIMMVNNTILNDNISSIHWNQNFALRIDTLCCVLVTEGTLILSIDYKKIEIEKNSLLFISPFNIVDMVQLSEDGRYFVLMVKKEFMEEAVGLGLNHLNTRRIAYSTERSPFLKLSDKEMFSLQRRFQTIYYYLKEDRGEMKKEFIYSSFITFELELIYLINSNLKHQITHSEDDENLDKQVKLDNRRNSIFRNFMILLNTNCTKEHSPAFYANKLFISVQYLSLILKEKTTLTASDWINNTLILNAKQLLRRPNASIATIAEELSFSDQSSFGKFFKKHTGITPKQYINSQK